MDDFDPSDHDFDLRESRPAHRDWVVDAIFALTKDERMAAKEETKNLNYFSGRSPAAKLARLKWVEPFEAFRKSNPHQKPDQPFTGDDLIEFFTLIIDDLDSVPEESTILLAAKILRHYGDFQWSESDGYNIGKRDKLRFQAFLDDCVQQKRVVRTGRRGRVSRKSRSSAKSADHSSSNDAAVTPSIATTSEAAESCATLPPAK